MDSLQRRDKRCYAGRTKPPDRQNQALTGQLTTEPYTMSRHSSPPAILALEDGTIYRGRAFGALHGTQGEVVFNTSMTGYQEILTDPSYYRQIVTMTYPQIGNYGIGPEDIESGKVQVAGFIVKELSRPGRTGKPSNWRCTKRLEDWLEENGVMGLEGIDTRALVRKLRSGGVLRGVITPDVGHTDEAVDRARAIPDMAGSDLVQHVSTADTYTWRERLHPMDVEAHEVYGEQYASMRGSEEAEHRVVAIDFGVKRNILRHLTSRGCSVEVVPATTSASDILALKPDGVFLSNGPGDPEPVTYGIATVRELLGKVPIFGICLGHQILGAAAGGRTYKLKFGHRGGNQPVKDMETGKVEITSQNHGFCLDMESLKDHEIRVTHVNLNDDTVEGLENRDARYFSVQYHPEASPGPHDASYHFDRFIQMME